jgi:hypothetical protein
MEVTIVTLDEAIIAAYRHHQVPADRIVADPTLNAQFAQTVLGNLDTSTFVDIGTINHRLLNLRRRGQANGGLPRLQRDYRGRGGSNN